MADRYLLETSGVDGYLLEDSSGVVLLEQQAAGRHLLHMLAPSIAAAFALYAGPEPHVISRVDVAQQTVGPRIGQPLLRMPNPRAPTVEVEQDTAQRHYQLYQQAAVTVTAGGMPLPLMATSSPRLEAEQYEARTKTAGHFHLLQSQNTVGQPFALNFKPALRLEPDPYEVRSAPPTIHRFRPGYQTVGNFLNSALAYKASLQVEAEQDTARHPIPSYPAATQATVAGQSLPMLATSSLRLEPEQFEVRTPAPTLHVFRTGFQTVAQPFAGNFKPATRVESESYEVRSAPPYLHLFRTGFQTVGQPLLMLCSPRATRIAETEFSVARGTQKYPSSRALTGGMPLPLLAYRAPRQHSLYDGAQFAGAYTDWEAYQQAFNPPPVIPQYNPLFLMQRKPMAWKHHEPIIFGGALPDWEKIGTASPDVATQSYDFQFLMGVYEVPDFNGPEWQEQVRYYTNHGRLMQAFRQYSTGASFTSMQFDAAALGAAKFCVEPEVWLGEPTDPVIPWVGDPAASGLWGAAPAGAGAWAPTSPDSGTWDTTSTPANPWDTQQKAC